MSRYTVQQGDCVESIAAQFGLAWEQVWNHPDNVELRKHRDPNVLLPGDFLSIPERILRWESCVTDREHSFVLKGRSSKLVLVLKDFDKPRASEKYVLSVDGLLVSGTTDQNGRLEALIEPGARTGRLLVGPSSALEEYTLQLGHIDPIQEVTGIEARLRNLGYRSLAEFQKKYRLDVTGQPDEPTLKKLRDEYGC